MAASVVVLLLLLMLCLAERLTKLPAFFAIAPTSVLWTCSTHSMRLFKTYTEELFYQRIFQRLGQRRRRLLGAIMVHSASRMYVAAVATLCHIGS